MIDAMSHVVYQHRDLKPVRDFLLDFGLLVAEESDQRIYFRGYGDAPFIYVAEQGYEDKFLGLGLTASSAEDLNAYATRFGVAVEDSPRPGGGKRAVIKDPDGKTIEIVHGRGTVAPIETREPIGWNSIGKRARLGRFPILDQGPCPILALGHTVMSTPDPQRMIDWLVAEFDAYPSDVITTPDGKAVLAFLRFPKAEEYVDHHHIAVSAGSKPGAQHTCFETIDYDAVQIGHKHLRKKGYKAAWGPVRHSLGGAISDYWRDPSGFILEHVTDGDLVNHEVVTAYSSIADEVSTLQWAVNPMPHDFID